MTMIMILVITIVTDYLTPAENTLNAFRLRSLTLEISHRELLTAVHN